jgi:hypothetical protein
MEGIRFLTDDKGHRFVEIDLDRHGEMWEDFHDHLVADARAHEKSIPWPAVKRRLTRTSE